MKGSMRHFSIQTITAIADAVTGGDGLNRTRPVGKYRAASDLETFFGGANIELVPRRR